MRNSVEMTARRRVSSRVSTRSVLRKSSTTELTSQPTTREKVRTFHRCQHTHSQLHSSRLSNARDTTTQLTSTASTELALWRLITLEESSLPVGLGRTPTVHWGRYEGRPWVARPHRTGTQHKDAEHAGIRINKEKKRKTKNTYK